MLGQMWIRIAASVADNRNLTACAPFVPSPKAISRMVQKERNVVQKMPPIPSRFEFEVPPDFSNTLDGLQFLIMDSTVPGRDGRVLGFSSPTGISLMKSTGSLFCDGTFEIA